MTHRVLTAAIAVMAVAVLAPAGVGGQTQTGESSGWTSPRTAWGDPDLQGRWTNTTTTPLQRPDNLEGRELLTEEERAALDEAGDVAREQRGVDAGTGETGSYNNFWVERGVRMARTSLIVDPPDGRLPPFTPFEAARRPARESYRTRVPAGPEDRNLYERCISRGMPGTMMPGFYNHNYQIFQAPGYVVILVEMIHDARIIPLDGRSACGRGDSPVAGRLARPVGRRHAGGRDHQLHPGERTRADRLRRQRDHAARRTLHAGRRPDTIDYEFTVSDPIEYTRPWTASIPMTSLDGLLYEYACHEGNYGLENILVGARATEQ